MKVACIIPCDKYRRVLVCKIGKPHPMFDYWVFAGGKQDESETLLDALHRETEEELNLKIGCRKIIHLISLSSGIKELGLDSIDYYFVEVSDEEKASMIICDREFSDHKWLTYRELAEFKELKSSHIPAILEVLNDPKNALEVINGFGPLTLNNGNKKDYVCQSEIRNITTLRSTFEQTGPGTMVAGQWECIAVLQQLYENPNTNKKKWIDIPSEWKILD